MPGFLDHFKVASSDRKREAICDHLNSIGVKANLAQRGSPEELFKGAQEQSLGLISIHDQVLDWVNVVRGYIRSPKAVDYLYSYRGPPQSNYYRIWYGIRDPNLKIREPKRIRSVRHRSLRALGRAVNVTWEDEFEQVHTDSLDKDAALKRSLIMVGIDVEVMAFPDGYWIISNRETARMPSRPMWDCYQAVAKGLLQKDAWPSP